MKLPQSDVVLAHQNDRLLVQRMDGNQLNRGHLETSAGEQFLLAVVEKNRMRTLHTHQQTGNQFLRTINSQLLDRAFDACREYLHLVLVWLEHHDVGHFLLVL